MSNTAVEKYFAEFGTDRLIRTKFFPDWNFKGTMVEVGAATPEFLSMSQHFRLNGWRCICVEPNPVYVEMHRKHGHEIQQYACSFEDKDDQDFEIVHKENNYEAAEITDHSFSALRVKDEYKKVDPHFKDLKVIKTKVHVRKLDTILAQLGISEISFLSVDVEGWELEVMQGFSLERFRPRVVLLENFLHSPKYTQYMRAHHYVPAAQLQYNYLYVPAAS